MTVLGRDASNYDGSISYDGLGFFTHKSTEGTRVTHDRYGPRLDAARAGVPALGSYHVVRTPGNGGNGTLAEQLAYWLAYQDAHTPWWRTWPHWMMQVDAEKWPYDNVSADTVKTFAALLVQSGVPGYKATYASRGQYGDSLAGIATDLWNADYRGSSGGSYPGDNWTVAGKGAAAGWAPYSGQTPRFLQYTSTPYDMDAFRGTLPELLALTRPGGTATIEGEDDVLYLLNILVSGTNPPQQLNKNGLTRGVGDFHHIQKMEALDWVKANVGAKDLGDMWDWQAFDRFGIGAPEVIDPAELTAIGQAAGAGVAAAVPAIVDALVAKLPADAMSRADIEAAVHHAIAGTTVTTTITAG